MEQVLKPEIPRNQDYDAQAGFAGILAGTPAWGLKDAETQGAAFLQGTLPYLSGRLKRSLDVALVVLCAPLAMALVCLTALAVKFTSRGPVFFVQERLGQHGLPFPCVKLRTMVVEAEQGTPRWAEDQDPRVTWVGRILRRARLDELPQIYNVWRGEMSFVGPRPIREHFATLLAREDRRYPLRFAAKPGLTGWDQVNHGYPNTHEAQLRKLRSDLFYLRHASFWLDLRILGKTLRVILGGQGQ